MLGYRGDIYAPSCVASDTDSVESDVPGKNVPSLFGALGLIKKAQKRNIYKKRGTSYCLMSCVMPGAVVGFMLPSRCVSTRREVLLTV